MKSTEFLSLFHPNGPYHLTAISPDKNLKVLCTENLEEVAEWVERHNTHENIYFSVNLPMHPLTKKALREDIDAVSWLHVDVDARAGEPLEEEFRRIRKLLTEECPVVKPTFVVFSGGGYQAFWKLDEPIPIKGDLAAAEEAARYNKQLEIVLGGDGCHNIDRIMRLPGTLNIPDEKKKARGRVPAMAEVYEYNAEAVYDISQFTPASNDKVPVVDVGSHTGRVDIEKLEIDNRLKVIAVQGCDPDNPKAKDTSRSAWVYDFLCNGMRQGLDDKTLFAIITDPDYGISAHVLDQKRSHEYALAQIAKARGTVDDDPVAWVNARYFASMEGGKVAYYREEDDGTIEAMQSSAFEFELRPKKHKINDKFIGYSTLWEASPQRRYYPRGFVLDPNQVPGPGYYNLWRGFSVRPAPGDWSRMQAHIHEVLADGNDRHADYIENWTAWTLQNPHVPPRVALVFQSDKEGVGKGAFCNALVRLFGAHGLRIQDMMQLTGRFNAHLRHCCLLFADEAVSPGSDGEGALKGYITEPTVPIERKGVDVVQADNHLHIVISSNNRAVIPAGPSARRFAVFSVSGRYGGDRPYFEKLFAEINGGGLAAMLHELSARDLGRWHPEAARPETDALSRQKVDSLPPVEATWFDVLLEGELPPIAERRGEHWKVHTQAMRDFVREQKKRPEISSNKVSDLFKLLGYEQVTSPRPRGFMLPSLERARQDWNERFFRWNWDEGGEWNGLTSRLVDRLRDA